MLFDSALVLTIALLYAIAAKRGAIAASRDESMMLSPLFKIGDEQGGVRISGTGSLPPPPAGAPEAAPPPMRSGGGGGGWSWLGLAVVIIAAGALYVVWRTLLPHPTPVINS